MKKDFITVSPDSGGGSTQVNVVADPNPLMKSRSTTLNFSAAGGALETADVVQAGVPWVMLASIFRGYKVGSGYPYKTLVTENTISEENGILTFKVNDAFSLSAEFSPWFVFYSDNSNTFVMELGYSSETYEFSKNGKIHSFVFDTQNDYQIFLIAFGHSILSKQASIKFNGTEIIRIENS